MQQAGLSSLGATQDNYSYQPGIISLKWAWWQTFVIHLVENGCTPGNFVPYLEYDKAQDTAFKVGDMYGIR